MQHHMTLCFYTRCYNVLFLNTRWRSAGVFLLAILLCIQYNTEWNDFPEHHLICTI